MQVKILNLFSRFIQFALEFTCGRDKNPKFIFENVYNYAFQLSIIRLNSEVPTSKKMYETFIYIYIHSN